MSKIPDQTLIQHLQIGDPVVVNKALTYLHRKVYQQVSSFIQKYQGAAQDVEDIFQDALLAIYKLARQERLPPDTNVEAYLFSICKNLWFQQLRKKKAIISIEDNPVLPPVQEVTLFRLLEKEKKEEIQRLISKIGSNCREVLTYFYFERMRMREIAELMNFSSEQVAKNKKSTCLKKLKILVAKSFLCKSNKAEL